MKLSIIVPVFNMVSGGKLDFCINSLLKQSLNLQGEAYRYEIILVDDCSTDNSYEVIKQYAAKYPGKCIAAQTKQNGHQGAARNVGLSIAQGEWIGFMDSDDWASPVMYESMIRKAENSGADVIGCDYTLVTKQTFLPGKLVHCNTKEQTGELTSDKLRLLMLKPESMVIKIYKADVIRENNLHFPENMFYEDNAMAAFWMFHFKHFEKIDEPLYFYYQYDTSTVHTITIERCRDRIKAGNIMVDEFTKNGYSEICSTELEFKYAELAYVNTLFSYMLGMKHQKISFLREMKRDIKKRFPDFQGNPYYLKTFDAEQKKLIAYHMKSCLFFLCFYKALLLFRKLFR